MKSLKNVKLSYDNAIELTKKYGQEHLLQYFGELSNEEKQNLLQEIDEIDFELINDLYENNVNGHIEEESEEIEPMEQSKELSSMIEEEKIKYYDIGIEAIKKGEVGALVVAGGQGTRLGHNGPKGTYHIGLPSGKSLFEIQIDRLKELYEKTNKYIYWYIMTSGENNKETIEFFEENNYFGYPKEHINFYMQEQLPMIDENGKILLKEKGEIVLGPNGNGGALLSLKSSGMLQHMKENGIKWVSFNGIDNVLVKIADPIFVGYTISTGMLAGSKVVYKRSPDERIGVFCYKNQKPAIVEYIEISKEMSEMRDCNGKLVYGAGNILNYLFSVEFIEKALNANLPYHVAHKKAAHLNTKGEYIEPNEPNAYKFESFIFDNFSVIPSIAILEVKREEEFAPVKNKEGEDSPGTARKMYLDNYR